MEQMTETRSHARDLRKRRLSNPRTHNRNTVGRRHDGAGGRAHRSAGAKRCPKDYLARLLVVMMEMMRMMVVVMVVAGRLGNMHVAKLGMNSYTSRAIEGHNARRRSFS